MVAVGISFGRFNPPHIGHVNLWKELSSCEYYYVGINPNTNGNKDPLPYTVKCQIIQQLCPFINGHIIPTKNVFDLVCKIYNLHGSNIELQIFTDEEWILKAISLYNGVEHNHGYYNIENIVRHETPRMTSASDVRQTIELGDRELFSTVAGISSNHELLINNKVIKYFDVIEQYIC